MEIDHATIPPGYSYCSIVTDRAVYCRCFNSKSYQLARTDLFYLARPYHDYLNMRYKYIEQAKAKGQHYLAVPGYQQAYPRSIFFNDIMQNPNHWRNACYADYFGLEKIKINKQRRESAGNDRKTRNE